MLHGNSRSVYIFWNILQIIVSLYFVNLQSVKYKVQSPRRRAKYIFNNILFFVNLQLISNENVNLKARQKYCKQQFKMPITKCDLEKNIYMLVSIFHTRLGQGPALNCLVSVARSWLLIMSHTAFNARSAA